MSEIYLDEALLLQGCEELGLSLSGEQVDRFRKYAEFLVTYNEKVNLTAVTDPSGIAVRHFVDSLALLKYCPPCEGASLADVGAGAGFPSVPLAILRPDLKITLIDSLGKRIAFLQQLFPLVGVKGEALHLRAEDAGKTPKLRERFDLVTARAVAKLPALCEYCLPLAKVGGSFAALKGPEMEEELTGAQNAIAALGGELTAAPEYFLPDGSKRTMIVVKKITHTLPQYPRKPEKIAKNPL